MTCVGCGEVIKEKDKFCPNCGIRTKIFCSVQNPPTMACVYCRDVPRCPHGIKVR